MTMAATSQHAVKGLDLGTSRIVLATLNGEDVDFTPSSTPSSTYPTAG